MLVLTVAAAVVFVAISLVQLENVGEFIRTAPATDLVGNASMSEDVRLYLLEVYVVEGRHNFMRASVLTRTWAKYLGFLAGVLLAFMGGAYVLGKLRTEAATVSVEGGGIKADLSTTSPGLFIAAAGVAVIIVSIYINPAATFTDASVYVSRTGATESIGGESTWSVLRSAIDRGNCHSLVAGDQYETLLAKQNPSTEESSLMRQWVQLCETR